MYDERCLLHDNGSMLVDDRVQGWLDVPHSERPERLTRTYQVLERSGVLSSLVRVPAREATVEELELVHPASLIETVRAASERGGLEWVGPEARTSAGTWTAARLAVGGLLEAVDRVVAGELENAFVCCRPPGHHASAEQAMGFCLFNAVAVAARHLGGRVAIIDWDVHHGNGTQEIFYADPSVLFVSLHQDDLYPKGMGTLEQRGDGTTVNIPLPAGTGDDGYRYAFERVVAPAVRRFRSGLHPRVGGPGRRRVRHARPHERDDGRLSRDGRGDEAAGGGAVRRSRGRVPRGRLQPRPSAAVHACDRRGAGRAAAVVGA